jgi:phage tail protein X
VSSSAFSRLRLVAAVSAVYDASVGVVMLAGRPLLAQLFDVALPDPPIHADLNGIFLLSIAAGYLIPYREPQSSGVI